MVHLQTVNLYHQSTLLSQDDNGYPNMPGGILYASATERTFNFCAFALAHFNTDDLRKKRTIFSTIGSNLTLKDKELNIQALHPFLLVENELKAQRKLYEWLEPEKDGYEQRKKAVFAASIPNWLQAQGSNMEKILKKMWDDIRIVIIKNKPEL
jgi:hypothetical protein